jgi:hypothetical protein
VTWSCPGGTSSSQRSSPIISSRYGRWLIIILFSG